jgi:hypothetical protein
MSLLFDSRFIDLVLRTVTMPLVHIPFPNHEVEIKLSPEIPECTCLTWGIIIGTRATVCHDSLVHRGDPVDYGGK